MKTAALQAALGSALILLSSPLCLADKHGHRLAHSHYRARHTHHHSQRHEHQLEDIVVSDEKVAEKRGVQCSLPDHPDLVPITPNAKNKGFAMAPDVACTSGMYCPIACKSGKVMAQWEPNSKYVYPQSMVGVDGQPAC